MTVQFIGKLAGVLALTVGLVIPFLDLINGTAELPAVVKVN